MQIIEDCGKKTITCLGSKITGKEIQVKATYNTLKSWLTEPVWAISPEAIFTLGAFDKGVMKKVLLEVNLKVKGQYHAIHAYRKEATIHIEPFPGLVIDDYDCFKENIYVTSHQVTIEKVRCNMTTDSILCYCENKVFSSSKLLNEQVKLLKLLNWYATGPHG